MGTADMLVGTELKTSIERSLASASAMLLDMAPSNPVADKSLKTDAPHVPKISAKQRDLLVTQHEALKALMANLKSSIKNINKAEASGKEEGKRQVERVSQRLASERAELKENNLTDFRRELLENRTKTDQKELDYWTRSRELQHGMFHTNLKMTHGLMSKANAVIEAYNSVMSSGRLNADLAKQLKAVSASLPNTSGSSVEQQAVEKKPVEQKPAEKKPVQQKPATQKAADLKAVQQKPATEKAVEQKPAEKKPIELKKVEQKPAEKKLVEQKPAAQKEVELKAVQQKSIEQKPVEQKPAEKKPVELKKVEQKPAEKKPVEQKPAAPKK